VDPVACLKISALEFLWSLDLGASGHNVLVPQALMNIAPLALNKMSMPHLSAVWVQREIGVSEYLIAGPSLSACERHAG
jgi:hypothetical protein